MATQTFDNYTITDVTYQVTGGTNVFSSHQTAVLTISPNSGYTVEAGDFSWINTSLAGINTVVFTQSGSNVLVTVTFDNPFTMPSSDTTLGLCIAGAAQPARNTISGTYNAIGVDTNLNIVSDCPVPQTIGYESSGELNQEILLIDKTYTVDSGYYFAQDFVVEYNGPNMVFESYNHIETKTLDSDGNHISSNFKFYYTFTSENVVIGDIIKLTVPNVKQIAVVETKITNYTLDTSLIIPVGDERTMRVFGVPTATFTLASNNGQIIKPYYFTASDDTAYTTTPTLTMPSSGFYDIKIDFPASGSVAQYCFTLAGGNLVSPFPKPNPVCINQYPDVTLTFNTTGTSNGQTFSVVGSPVTKTYTANTEPQEGIDAYTCGFTWTVTAANGAAMTLTGNEADWSNLPDIITSNTSAVSNSATVPVISATGLSNGMRMLSNLPGIINVATTGNPPAATITNISSNDLTISPNQTLSFASGQLTNLLFSSQKGSSVYLPTNVVLNDTGTTATVKVTAGVIERYGDSDVTYTLDLASLLTIGSANQCKEFDVTVGASGGTLTYFDCVQNTKRTLVIFKGESNFSICAMASPAPTVTGTMSIAASGDVCDFSGVDATCVTWSIAYTNSPQGKSVDITYFDCVTLAENTITVGRGQTVTQCATRQTPVSTTNGTDSGATITISNLTCSP